MFSQAFGLVYGAVSSIFSMFTDLVNHLGFGGMLLTLFTIYTVVRLLLRPLFGAAMGAGSDKVAKRIKSKEN